MKNHIKKYHLFYLAILLMWLKVYIVSRFYFDLSIENHMQEFILLLSPLSSAVLFFGFSLFGIEKSIHRRIAITSLLLSLILYMNVLFYRFFNDFITIPVLFQTSNAGDLGSSITSLLYVSDTLFFIDSILLMLYILIKKPRLNNIGLKTPVKVISSSVILFLLNLGIAETERPELLTRAFDREMLIKNIGTYNYHIYDIVIQSQVKAKKAFADGNELIEVLNYVNTNKTVPNKDLTGIAKDKNVIVISMESLQSFVINNDLNGEEITPFLNSLIKDSYYFPNFYHQTAQGKTSDSEFLLENSLYPLPSGAVFFTHGKNTYEGLPNIMSKSGRTTAVFHANNKSFWNRDVMYPSLGYETFYDETYFDISEENSIGWGLKDEYFFEQSIPYLKEMEKPYYAKYITLTNHFPFALKKEDEYIPEWTSEDGTVNRYFTTVRYMDESFKNFFESLKNDGLYENSIFILYGDHYGISENHNKAMSEYLEKEITDYETIQLQKVPLIIHIPGYTDNGRGKVIDTVGGQIDLKPTIMNLVGLEDNGIVMFGQDLFSKDHRNTVIFRNGDYVTKGFISTGESCYLSDYGIEVESKYCNLKEHIDMELKYSDKIIYGDLLRMKSENLSEFDDIDNKIE